MSRSGWPASPAGSRARAAGPCGTVSSGAGTAGRRCWPRSACSPSPGPARASRPWRPRTRAIPRQRRAGRRRRPRCRARLPDRAVAVAAPAGETLRVAGGMWGAKLINRHSFSQGSLTGSGDSLYGVIDGSLARVDAGTGAILQTAPYSPPVFSRPVVVGNTVWVVWSYGGGEIILRGYDARTLAQVASVPVAAAGGVSNLAQGVLTAGPDGKLYVAAGDSVATVDPAARQVTHRISLTAGRASSVAVSPDGSKLYVGVVPSTPSGSFRVLV